MITRGILICTYREVKMGDFKIFKLYKAKVENKLGKKIESLINDGGDENGFSFQVVQRMYNTLNYNTIFALF